MGECSWLSFEKGVKTVLTYIFSHIGLCSIVLLYSLAGAFLFQWLEQKAFLPPHNATEHLQNCADQIQKLSESHGLNRGIKLAAWRSNIEQILESHEKDIAKAVQEDRYDKTADDLESRWSLINSLFYCVTVITTIGYGHITPTTTYGRMVTILYSLLGIPLMLLCLNNIGDSMASTFRFGYEKIFCCTEARTKDNLPVSSEQHRNSVINKETTQSKSSNYAPSRKNMLISPPISVTIHRGSDLPIKMPDEKNCFVTSSTQKSLSTQFSFNSQASSNKNFASLSPNDEYDVHSIIYECASYARTPLFDIKESMQKNNYSIKKSSHSRLNLPHVINGSSDQSSPSSPLVKEETWYKNLDHYSEYPCQSTDSTQSSRLTSPSPACTEQNFASTSSSSLTYDWSVQNERFGQETKQKLPPGKTLVVYNTMSGDALKQHVKIQKKIAMDKNKSSQIKNDSTTVFTDPVSGQPVNSDMLGLHYRPVEIEHNSNETRVPMTLVLSFVSSYLLLGALLFSSLESWRFLDSFYFCFITLSTIGFGDLVPGNLGYETRDAQFKLVALALYVLMGLAVLAMSFSLLQEEVILKCKAFAQRIGLKDDI